MSSVHDEASPALPLSASHWPRWTSRFALASAERLVVFPAGQLRTRSVTSLDHPEAAVASSPLGPGGRVPRLRRVAVGAGSATLIGLVVAASLAQSAAAANPLPNHVICIETRGSRATVGDINALRSCKQKPGSIRVTFAQLFPGAGSSAAPAGPAGPRGRPGRREQRGRRGRSGRPGPRARRVPRGRRDPRGPPARREARGDRPAPRGRRE
jgi:hypothetical protein